MLMQKLRKMLGDPKSPECVSLMRLMETQSKATLANWAIAFAKQEYLEIYQAECSRDTRLCDAVRACEAYLAGNKTLGETKPLLRAAVQAARDAADKPAAQAAARSVSTACSTIQTPTNALGFLFYGAAATAYSRAGLAQTAEVYSRLASEQFKRALDSLRRVCISDEQHPVKINWDCSK
ncbi:hypothetical protein CLOSTMETH_00626 [[Clostridium] methylpentosum DSM 5476]|uniref:Imm-5-like domain-containing protein n=1 Tax=[Clostridium] methylpentosum DSM 5476 TaxID=537013 RepID=C0E9X4_9FIRM|nr:hypothetical protein CLOSTMETH_00626 [[Clostridium] methylpentosum DSM 5476]